MLRVNRVRKARRLREVGRASLAPEHVGVGRIAQGPRYRRFNTWPDAEIAFGRALAGDVLAVTLIDVARQERGGMRIRAGDHDCRHAADIGSKAGGHQCTYELRRRHEHLTTEMSALLLC